MGLDISAYKGLKKLDATVNEDGEAVFRSTGETLDWQEYCTPYINPDFEGRAEGLEADAVYGFEASMGFRAGSYSGYNWWRRQLAVLAGYGSDQKAFESDGGPLWELICFSDCEGSIGPVVSAKLAREFAELQPKVDALADTEEYAYFRSLYASWREAFEMAAQGGMVDFH